MKRTTIQRKTGLRRTTRLSAVSKKRAIQLKEYRRLRAPFLDRNRVCEVCNRRKSQDVHHARGRIGLDLIDLNGWMAVCRPCHQWLHDNPREAKAKGWLGAWQHGELAKRAKKKGAAA